ncbi:PAS domain-containing sensor histidine kinase [Acidithiobacillus sp. IBUN Pt1247-S3]|uniref:sensor histidine kinase n=1 Tax=Acidithiobacillus sp. IBUN Pt1247-S3 TaxID=3166642 RepID=UPI0034E3C875
MPGNPDPQDAARLLEAFELFNTASRELSDAYGTLQAEVHRLNGELAAANQRLREELLAKETLGQRLAMLLEMLPGAVLLLDPQGQILQMNPAAERLLNTQELGWTWPELPGLAIQEGGAECLLPDAAGRRRLAIAVTPLAGEGGKILLLQDVTAAREREATSQRRERLAALGETMAGLAHQLRTPLATALLAVGQLQPERDVAHFQRQQQRALDRLRHLQGIIDAMLQFLRGSMPGEGSAVRLADLSAGLERVFTPLYRQKSVDLDLRLGDDDWILTGTADVWVSVIGNLLQNALNFSPASTVVHAVGERSGNLWILRVSDCGPGVPEAERERIFQPFVSGRREGTGLGLSIARNFATGMGGELCVEDAKPGASFVLQVPLATFPEPLASRPERR